MHLDALDVPAFTAHLEAAGAEIRAPTNPWEVLRYAHRGGVHIVYRKANGFITFTGASEEHWREFSGGKAPRKGKMPPAIKRDVRERLRARDGAGCWYCGLLLGEDETIEHLIPASAGGGHALHNLALAHAVCNQAAGDLPLVDKLDLRQKQLAARADEPPWH